MTTHITHSPQIGTPGHCNLAQLFAHDGKSMAAIDATNDPAEASDRARRLAACWNACEGMSTESVEELANIGGTPALIVYGDDVRRERDEARAAINGLLNAIHQHDDGEHYLGDGGDAAIAEANRVSVKLAGRT